MLTVSRGTSDDPRVARMIALALGFALLLVTLLCGCTSESEPAARGESSEEPSSTPAAEEQASRELADATYEDPKGFFTIDPPADWGVTEYPDDPRGKVAFDTERGRVELRVLVKTIAITDLGDLAEQLEDVERRVGVDTNIEAIVFNDQPAFRRTATLTMQGMTNRLQMVDLLIDGVSHNMQYSAPPARFDEYYDLAWKSMQTYVPLAHESADGEATAHNVAKWLRLATIAIDWGNTDAAKEAVAAGLEADPTNEELLELDRRLKGE